MGPVEDKVRRPERHPGWTGIRSHRRKAGCAFPHRSSINCARVSHRSGRRVGTLIDLFCVLDGSDKDRFPNELAISPDPSIHAARLALRGLGDPQGALTGLEEQIKLARMLMRSVRFDVVEHVASERGWSPQKIFSLGADLHRLSALLNVQLHQLDTARVHLLRAIACRPDDPNLAFYLVDVYCQERRFADGFTLLDRTFEAFAPGQPDHLLGLYRLTLDAHIAGALTDATQLYESILRKPNVGVFAELATRQLHHIEIGANALPAIDVLNYHYAHGWDKLKESDFEAALSSFCDILVWRPDHEASWFAVGDIFTQGVSQKGQSWKGQDNIRIKICSDLDDVRRGQLLNAVQSLRIASFFDHDPNVALESHRLLTACYLELADPMQAVQTATVLTEKDPDHAASWATLSMARLLNLEFEEAADAASKALSIDRSDPAAKMVLAMLKTILDKA
jgi:tetratricopeptide (TPR) repeat protein